MIETTTITASLQTLVTQALDTAETYPTRAVERFDAAFGKGYARGNPQLVGAFMQISAQDLHTSLTKLAIQELTTAVEMLELDGIASTLFVVADALKDDRR